MVYVDLKNVDLAFDRNPQVAKKMTFFSRERKSFEKSSSHGYDHNQHFHDMLDGLNGNYSFGMNSGFEQSPYEIFRQNVAKYCEHFMCTSFDQEEFMSAEEKSLSALRGEGYKRFGEGYASNDDFKCHEEPWTGDDYLADSHEDEDIMECTCSNNINCQQCRLRRSKSATNIFSIMSVNFEPESKPKKPSLLKKLTHCMNFDSYSNKQKLFRSVPTKQQCGPIKWKSCECHVHIGKHSNCCQCEEPYHRMNCDCVQHNGSHSYCCRCDLHLLQEYDQYLRKKRYLRLASEEEPLSPVNSVDYQDGEVPKPTGNSPKIDKLSSGKKPLQINQTIPSDSCDKAMENDSDHQPCESCCRKLDNIYGTALREVHNMLMDVSRTLLPAAHCCSLETRIQNVSRLRGSNCQMTPQYVEPVESDVAEPEWNSSGTSEVGVQVTPNDLGDEENSKRETQKRKKRTKKCTIS